LVEDLRFNVVQRGKVGIQQDLLAADKIDPTLDQRNGSGCRHNFLRSQCIPLLESEGSTDSFFHLNVYPRSKILERRTEFAVWFHSLLFYQLAVWHVPGSHGYA
jgi:hypothetical protein